MTGLFSKAAEYFPYREIRPHQDEFANAIYTAVEAGDSVLIEGSNGLGKTVAAISACLPKALEEHFTVLYLARTHRQHERVIEELKAVTNRKTVSGISIRGRNEMCLNNFANRHDLSAVAIMEICELLKAKHLCKYYQGIEERENEYLQLLQSIISTPCKASEIRRICRSRSFCPYQLAKAALSSVNVIASSYLYVFDPKIRSHFLKELEKPLDKIILIVDEAHNLPETAMNIASSTLSLFTLKRSEIEAKKARNKDIADFARIVGRRIQSAAEETNRERLVSSEFLMDLIKEKASVSQPKEFFEHVLSAGSRIKRGQLKEGKYPRSFIHSMAEFFLKWLETAQDQSYVNLITKYMSRRGTVTAKLEIVALDPSRITEPVFSSTYSNIIMSGTLQPLDAYMKITKLPENTISKVVPPPFPKEHVLPFVCCGVTTAMEKRTSDMYEKIVRRISEVVNSTPANTGIFAASFEVLNALLASDLENTIAKPVLSEKRGMTSRENERMVSEFKALSKDGGAALLGVQGGRSSEGVDYPGDEMNSVVIVGVPYAEPTPKVRAQIDYFEKRFRGSGWEYGYVVPAMKKASQAAGRPIRTPCDRAAVAFLDYRFATGNCQRFLPSWIRDNLKILADDDVAITRELVSFFKTVC